MTTFKNLAQIISDKPQQKVYSEGKPPFVFLEYTQPTYADPTHIFKVGAFADTISTDLKQKLKGIKSGDKVYLHVKKEGKYSTLVDITLEEDEVTKPVKVYIKPSTSKESSTKTTFKPAIKSGYDSDGMQVGNALNNAATILGAGASVEALENTAWDIILSGERLKLKLSAHRQAKDAVLTKEALKASTTTETKQKVINNPAPEDIEDLMDDTINTGDEYDWD